MLKFQEMFEHPHHLTLDRVFLALAQIVDFLGHILPVHVFDSVLSQGIDLSLDPGVVIAVVEL